MKTSAISVPLVTCCCPKVGPTVDNDTHRAATLKRPAHMYPTARGDVIGVDPCIVPMVRWLWDQGIWTMASCCGHHRARPSIGVAPEHSRHMLDLGFESFPDRDDLFYVDKDQGMRKL